MLPASRNLIVPQGATFAPPTMILRYTATKAPFDLSGYTGYLHIMEHWWSGTLLAPQLTTENGGVTLGGAAGTIVLLLTAVQTAAITWKNGVYVLRLVSGSTIKPILRGNITLNQWKPTS